MPVNRLITLLLGAASLLGVAGTPARAENLAEAWASALAADQRLQASRQNSVAAGLDLGAAQRERVPTLRTTNSYVFLDSTPAVTTTLPQIPQSPIRLPSTLTTPFAQNNFLLSNTAVNVPVYTGGRIRNQVEAASATLNATRTEEVRTALNVKLEVTQAYIQVLRSQRLLDVARSNVVSLRDHVRVVKDLVDEGVAAENDLLATQVSLSNAEQRQLQAENALDESRSTYNRTLLRPLTAPVVLDELPVAPAAGTMKDLAAYAARVRWRDFPLDEAAIQASIDRALRIRPELAGLTESARAVDAQAGVLEAATKPQVGISGGFLFVDNTYLAKDRFWYANFGAEWTLYDGGKSQRRAQAARNRRAALNRMRTDLGANIALEVRNTWLRLRESHNRIGVALTSLRQADENLRVARDRYQKQVGTNTEVLDAETLRLQNFSNYYNAVYDFAAANFTHRRAIGDL